MKRQDAKRPYLPHEHTHSMLHDLTWTAAPVVLALAIAGALVFWLLDPAPPRTITISAGQTDSSFYYYAEEYAKILARNGVTLKVMPSDGSVQNLHRLLDPKERIDLALVQGGVASKEHASSLISLGSVSYVPLVVFYRGKGLTQLSQLEGKRIAIGREGSGTRMLSLKLLEANGIRPGGSTELFATDGLDAATQLVSNQVDAVFLSGDSATRALMLRILKVPGVSVMDFQEARAYTRVFPYLDEIDLPPGVLDLGRRVPSETVHLVAPTVELVARPTLHPALSDLLIEAAQEVHGKPGLLQRGGQFPNFVAHEFPISEDANRYYHSGKGFFYRVLPFWLANIADRALVLLLPVAVLIFPALRIVPGLYRWRVRSRIYRYYGALLAVERGAMRMSNDEERKGLLVELDYIEESLNTLKVPLAYADALYVLREHIGFVRSRLSAVTRKAASEV
ncbi:MULTISPECIES: TAXI family TRAP transporter solute-binding subunit [unclassified Caballeronia]|uniref:TAXI family TRAP transporter solute-binding subunit n=1 Tax=unclassified Caballeronia TaxID=2646786 RepID=UPI00285E0FFE|nr:MULTISPECIES: TAXI family TRAP transporter solute-binding subunit [unclassified Caballeronia]MDR5774120.1 TAXI family TRAP transporter solute-binding subunit [Caballeronia sp. LZ002]MDR5849555.1 TAXI family TRAP transporter solute-binding subunit [Caballeronia sp. LZ003]